MDTQRRYSIGAMIFHWVIAIAVIWNWRLVENAHELEGPARGAMMDDHKALGITILALTVGRIIWRLTHSRPELQNSLAAWEVALARVVHALFYILLIALPLLGWIGGSLYGGGIDWFGAFEVPALPLGKDAEAGKTVFSLHELLGKGMLILIALHILGALKHQFIDRNGELYRMLPFGTSKS